MKYTVYNKYTGEIVKQVTCPQAWADLYVIEDWNTIDGAYNDSVYYVDIAEEIAKEKLTLPGSIDKIEVTADREDTVTISNLPTTDLNGNFISVQVKIGRQKYEIDDGIVEITFDSPGKYTITCKARTYLDKNFEVDAV